MTIEYQLSILCYLAQSPDSRTLINDLDESLFDLLEDQITIQILKKYYKLYSAIPSPVVARQFLNEQISS